MLDLLTIVGFSASLSLSHRICIVGPSNLHHYYRVQILQHFLTISNFQHLCPLLGMQGHGLSWGLSCCSVLVCASVWGVWSSMHAVLLCVHVLVPGDVISGRHADEHGCRSWHVSNSNSTSIKHLSLLPSPTASSQPTLPHSIHHLSSIICHQWQLLILSLLNSQHLDFSNIQ